MLAVDVVGVAVAVVAVVVVVVAGVVGVVVAVVVSVAGLAVAAALPRRFSASPCALGPGFYRSSASQGARICSKGKWKSPVSAL